MLKLAHISFFKRAIIHAVAHMRVEVAIRAFAFAEWVMNVNCEWLHQRMLQLSAWLSRALAMYAIIKFVFYLSLSLINKC